MQFHRKSNGPSDRQRLAIASFCVSMRSQQRFRAIAIAGTAMRSCSVAPMKIPANGRSITNPKGCWHAYSSHRPRRTHCACRTRSPRNRTQPGLKRSGHLRACVVGGCWRNTGKAPLESHAAYGGDYCRAGRIARRHAPAANNRMVAGRRWHIGDPESVCLRRTRSGADTAATRESRVTPSALHHAQRSRRRYCCCRVLGDDALAMDTAARMVVAHRD